MYFRLHKNNYYGSLRVLIFLPVISLYVDIYLLLGMLVGMFWPLIGQHHILPLTVPL